VEALPFVVDDINTFTTATSMLVDKGQNTARKKTTVLVLVNQNYIQQSP